jgi:RNA polymerase sigma-70 factor (ECF subfamily)
MLPEAYERVVMEHKDRVFGYASAMLRNPAEAQDVAQEALIRLWNHRAEVDSEGAHRWLRRTAHNLCIDRLRRAKCRPEDPAGDDLERGADHSPSPLRRAEASEVGRALGTALAALPERDRAVILLREVEGLAYEEIAEILEVPLGTLKARLHRAREHLRARLVRAGVTP